MRIAHIVVAHKYPEQLVRLIRRLNTETTSFLVHIDKKSDDGLYHQVVTQLHNLPNVYFLERHECYWGEFSLVRTITKGIREIIDRDIPCDYVNVLTGQDYPIKSNAEIERFLRKNVGKLFMDHFPLPAPPGWVHGGMDRIERWHFRLFNRRLTFPQEQSSNASVLSSLCSVLTYLFPIKRRFPKGFKPFGGSAYWCLSRECVEYIYDFIDQNRRLVNFFKYVAHPDEIFFQTIVLNSHFRDRVVNDDLRYIEWPTPTSASPVILRSEDLEKLVKSTGLFARKFDMTVDADILDMVDQEILGISAEQVPSEAMWSR